MLANIVKPESIQTLEQHYETLTCPTKIPPIPITTITAYGYYIDLIDDMELPNDLGDVLDEMMLLNLANNTVHVNGLFDDDYGVLKGILINNISFGSFGNMFVCALFKMYGKTLTIECKIVDYDEDLQYLTMSYVYHLKLTSATLFGKQRIPFTANVYIDWETPYNYTNEDYITITNVNYVNGKLDCQVVEQVD